MCAFWEKATFSYIFLCIESCICCLPSNSSEICCNSTVLTLVVIKLVTSVLETDFVDFTCELVDCWSLLDVLYLNGNV